MKRRLFLSGSFGFFLMFVFNVSGVAATNQLNKIFHHKNGTADKQGILPNIELGSVVFYFAQCPQVLPIQQVQTLADIEEKSFVFDAVGIQSTEARSMMQTLNASKGNLYTVKIEEVKGTKPAIKFLISFNPKKVDLSYEMFDSIGAQKGVVFKFLNKELVHKLEAKLNKPILNVVHAAKPQAIVIDCGHGGNDAGTVGFFNIKEKDITLDVGLQLADLLKKKGFAVHLTRDADLTVGLDQRTSFANNIANAQLFISLHANHSSNPQAMGIETFCLDTSLLRPLFSTVGTSSRRVVDRLMSERCAQGKCLAEKMQGNVIMCVKKNTPRCG